MREVLKRLERLEGTNANQRAAVLIGWKCDPVSASRAGVQIEREAAESVDSFTRRAAEQFKGTPGFVWLAGS